MNSKLWLGVGVGILVVVGVTSLISYNPEVIQAAANASINAIQNMSNASVEACKQLANNTVEFCNRTLANIIVLN